MAVDIDSSRVKVIALASVSVFLALIFGYFFRKLSFGFTVSDLLNVAAILTFWIVVFVLSSLLIKSINIGFGVVFLQAFAIWILLPSKFSLFALLAIVALVLGLMMGFLKGRTEMRDLLKIKFLKISRHVSSLVLTGIALFITLYLLSTFNFPEFTISKGAFEFSLKGVEPIVAQFIPGFSLDAPFDETLKNFIRSRVPQETTETAVNEAASNLHADITKGTGTALEAADKTIDAFYKIFIFKLFTLPQGLKNFVFLALGLLIFVLIKGINFFINLIVNGLAFLIYELLLAFNFMYIGSENRTKEVLIVD